MRGRTGLALLALALASPAAADVTSSDSDGFVVRIERTTPATTAEAFAMFATPARWWSPIHTWSGDAAQMTLDPVAGGCWCERLVQGGSAEHGHVIRWDPENGRILMRAELGPLQNLPVNGKLEWVAIAGPDGVTRVAMRYDVSGRGIDDPAALAAAVDHVLTQQLDRMVAALAAHPATERSRTAPTPP